MIALWYLIGFIVIVSSFLYEVAKEEGFIDIEVIIVSVIFGIFGSVIWPVIVIVYVIAENKDKVVWRRKG